MTSVRHSLDMESGTSDVEVLYVMGFEFVCFGFWAYQVRIRSSTENCRVAHRAVLESKANPVKGL